MIPGTLVGPGLVRDDGGAVRLQGWRCTSCDAVQVRATRACPACCGRALDPVDLPLRGTLRAFTVVHRTFAGVSTPFVSAVVELDGGGGLRGALKPAPVDLDVGAVGRTVAVVVAETDQRDAAGRPFVTYHFEPLGGLS